MAYRKQPHSKVTAVVQTKRSKRRRRHRRSTYRPSPLGKPSTPVSGGTR